MGFKPAVFQQFEGGKATDLKVGPRNSFGDSISMDFRSSPSQLTLNPQPTREDAEVVTDLVQNTIMVDDGTIYGIGSSGKFYKRTTAGAWSVEGGLSVGAYGMDYRKDLDSVYICHPKTVSLYNPISTSPILLPDNYNTSKSAYNNSSVAGFNVNADQEGSALTTTLATALLEGPTSLRYFQTDIEPLNKLTVFVIAKGTGNWTLTLHDGLNNVLGTVTVSNANLTSNSWNNFIFTSQVRASVAPAARTYHWHLTSTVADGTVSSSATNDLSTADMQLWADRLVATTNGMHPMANFQQFEVIGNERYLSVWEPLGDPNPDNTEWKRHRLTFPPGYQVCGLSVLNEFLAIACERIPTGNSTVQDGIIFWWDGLSDTYNYDTKVPEGSPYGLQEYNNMVYYFAGGAWYEIAGANSVPKKKRSMPNFNSNYSGVVDKTIVYPYASTVRRGILLSAYPSTSTNQSLLYGIYSWGSIDEGYAPSFGHSFPLSTGDQYNTSGNLTIGMVKNFGDTLLTSWRGNDGSYGVDVVNNSSKPAAYAKYQTLILDNSYVGKKKTASYVDAYYSLPSGSTIKLGYSINRVAPIVGPGYTSSALWLGETGYARFGIDSGRGRFREIWAQVEIFCDSTVTTSPTIYEEAIVFDDCIEEKLV